MQDNIIQEKALPQYEKAIQYCLQIINNERKNAESRKQALKDLAVLQLSYDYMEKHKTASGYPAQQGLLIPFDVLIAVEKLESSTSH
jgi:hypothetical protein